MASEKAAVTPEDVIRFEGPTPTFLCPFTANTYGIDFLSFLIRDEESKKVVFSVAKDPTAPAPDISGFSESDLNQLRSIAYRFPAAFLRYKTVGTTLVFRVGPQEVRDFRMIERHYHGNQLIKSYDFNFSFCIPNSVNTWEAIYDMPTLSEETIASIMAKPELNHSDSFYFVGGKLIMHNKASYAYVDEDTKGEVVLPGAASASASPAAATAPSSSSGSSGSSAAGSSSAPTPAAVAGSAAR